MLGCLDVSEGTLTLADAGSACDSGLVPVAWQSDQPETGAPGSDGADGADGATGKTGADGADGKDGAAGQDGSSGRNGAAGGAGAAGAAGSAGRNGAAGRAGSTGVAGANGVDGKDGHAGTPGREGADGAAGKDGVAGTDGKDGAEGRQGDKGDKGDTGEQGERGEQGQTGATGAAGQDGVPAWEFVSDWSAAATYTAGPPTSIVTFGGATYVAARSSVGAPPAESPSDWILIAAAGLKGERGEKGEAGAAGAAGKDGADGADGAAGAQGSQGVQGVQGLRGLAGAAPWVFSGTYDSAAEYSGVAPASVVEYEGATYVATREEAFSGVLPTDTATWALLAAKGAPGATGERGVPGPQGLQGVAGNSDLQKLFGTNTQRAASGHATECMVGSVLLTAGAVADGMPANGQLLSIQGYQALYSLFGTTYGGNGSTTFGLPDMRGLAPNNMTYSICMNGIYPQRD